ncbi:adenylate/guanylate cyclase domain-containing protein [Komarekiella sp. 'clone 1']|uniref:Adenylate/guanylate cyclase domain-containing protein n=1 Tax=Komarekiella delphini-convector SJRDD-AB1 TaxID=2593771 RepID=A0AA40VU42_9NOST|nr:adenylate/guanylate cyclase domain-containing protein [Komarekiella delphini-convector]MBD6619800.1 adenylate/guanylate cyclase domain-containing protein [Komarekiella delphini-convector SJRDD-AB1]
MALNFQVQSLRNTYKSLKNSILEKYPLFPGMLTTFLSVSLWQVSAWNSLELLGFNLIFRTRNYLPHSSWDQRIAVIGIDDRTLQQYGQFPLSRDRYIQLLETLEATPPTAIGFDILFTEPTNYDAELAEAMAINGTVVLAVAPSLQQQTLHPVAILDGVTSKGHIVNNADFDGITRQFFLYIDRVPSLGIKLLETYNNTVQHTFTANTNKNQKSLITIPSLQSGMSKKSVWINWVEPTEKIPTYSFADVLQKKIDIAKLKNKIVLVGLTATGTNDPLKTPFPQTVPTSGIYIHAAVLDNLLNQRFLRRLPWQFELLLLLTVSITITIILTPQKFYQRILLLGLLPLIWFSLSVLALATTNLLLPTAAPIGTILLAGLSVQWQEQREKQQLMSLFASHVSQDTARLIWQNRTEIFQNGQLDAKEMVVTVLFSDIRSFTTISEGMKPRELLNWLNIYLGAMAECVHKHHGVIDKYIGDAVMAVFGIPFPHTQAEEIQQDAINAVSAAIAMQERLILLNKELEQLGQHPIQIGIGIHTGLVVAGSIGGSQRLDYSVLGDAVNIAARLEQLNKNTPEGNPNNILVSETTHQLVKDNFGTQKLKELTLQGRRKLTVIYSVTEMKSPMNSTDKY